MKKLKFRLILICLLLLLCLGGIIFFVYEYVTNAKVWAFQPFNKHVTESEAVSGRIFDIHGEVLAETINGKRVYNKKELVRKAVMHTVGDGTGFISTSIQNRFMSKIAGYNIITGFGAPRVLGTSSDIKLTLDSELCAFAFKELNNRKGTVIFYNYLTGHINCLVSSPSYDPVNKPDLTLDVYEGTYINKAISSSFTPGSIAKIITTAAGLEYIPNIENRKFVCSKTKIVDGEKIVCMQNHGKINLQQALTKSCDIAFADIAIELGPEKMTKAFEDFGFNKQFNIDGIEIKKSNYTLENATKADLGWSAIGQYKDLVNPMHMLMIMGAIANDGHLRVPTVIKSIDDKIPDLRTSENINIKPEIAQKLKEMMNITAKENYSKTFKPELKICAKTGTAEVGNNQEPHSWIVGFSKNIKTPYAFVVIAENSGFGSRVAHPIAASVMNKISHTSKGNKFI